MCLLFKGLCAVSRESYLLAGVASEMSCKYGTVSCTYLPVGHGIISRMRREGVLFITENLLLRIITVTVTRCY